MRPPVLKSAEVREPPGGGPLGAESLSIGAMTLICPGRCEAARRTTGIQTHQDDQLVLPYPGDHE